MSTYWSNHLHVVFGTKSREKAIARDVQPKLWAYIAGIARNHGMRALAVGGTGDHVHVLMSVPPTLTLAKAVQLLKANSSKWLNENDGRGFAWQEGYGAFSVSRSNVAAVSAYIRNQEQHHSRRSFDAEFSALLERHGIRREDVPSLRDSHS
jgi:REP element-mobilizing transposase RayT